VIVSGVATGWAAVLELRGPREGPAPLVIRREGRRRERGRKRPLVIIL